MEQSASYNAYLISIHALLAESDGILVFCGPQGSDFYPRSPCGERPFMTLRHCTTYLFLSTLSLRRATQVFQRIAKPFRISIHALLAESDSTGSSNKSISCNFYPRSPCGERPLHIMLIDTSNGISIHALLAESDHNADCNYRNDNLISIHALLAESDIQWMSHNTKF